ncbi:MAG: hypothetical protein K6F49_13415 [Saccharofermentans sp.]|nr:hypothetical protein [Saccharofermentans sp.]
MDSNKPLLIAIIILLAFLVFFEATGTGRSHHTYVHHTYSTSSSFRTRG